MCVHTHTHARTQRLLYLAAKLNLFIKNYTNTIVFNRILNVGGGGGGEDRTLRFHVFTVYMIQI